MKFAQLQQELQSSPKNWLVTGAAGFIGSALVEELLRLGQRVIGFDNFLTGHRKNLDEAKAAASSGGSFELIEADVRDEKACQSACKEIDYVLHQAALGSVPRSIKEPIVTHAINVTGFVNVITAARDAGVKRLVYASSSSVYGDAPTLPKREHDIGRPLSPYAVSKYLDEVYAAIYQDCYGIESIGLRYFNVFGRRQDPNGAYAAVIPRWIDELGQGSKCTIFGDGETSRDFCYVDNVVQANLLAATAPPEATNAVYNVGCGGRTTLNELFGLIRDSLAKHRDGVAGVQPAYADEREGDVKHSQASVEKLIEAVGYQPTHDIASGMEETVTWFARSGADR